MYVKNGSNSFQCKQCGHLSSQKPNIVNHIESKHLQTPGVVCELCQKHLRTRQAYRMHYHRDHGLQTKTKYWYSCKNKINIEILQELFLLKSLIGLYGPCLSGITSISFSALNVIMCLVFKPMWSTILSPNMLKHQELCVKCVTSIWETDKLTECIIIEIMAKSDL